MERLLKTFLILSLDNLLQLKLNWFVVVTPIQEGCDLIANFAVDCEFVVIDILQVWWDF